MGEIDKGDVLMRDLYALKKNRQGTFRYRTITDDQYFILELHHNNFSLSHSASPFNEKNSGRASQE